MRLAELSMRALLGGLATEPLDRILEMSPNPSFKLVHRALPGGLAMVPLDRIPEMTPHPASQLARRAACTAGDTACGTGCMPVGGACCIA